jgi:hypothetical protein
MSITALSGAVLLMSGCAGFPANKLSKVPAENLHFASAAKTKVFSRWALDKSSGMNDQSSVALAAVNKKYFDDALRTADCCTIVESPDAADLVVDGTIFKEDQSAAMVGAFLTGFTFGVIPSWVTIDVHITAAAKGGGKSQSYDLKDSMTMVTWLPMLFVMPFAENPIKYEKKMTENVFNTLVVKIKADGLLK